MDQASDQTESTQTMQTKLDCVEVPCLGEQTNQEVSGGVQVYPNRYPVSAKKLHKKEEKLRTKNMTNVDDAG